MLKSASIADNSTENLTQKNGFFRVSDLFVKLSSKGLLDTDLAWSPTSPLDYKTFSNLSFSLKSPKSLNNDGKPKCCDSNKVGLGLIDTLNDEKSTHGSRKVLIGSEFKKPNKGIELESDKGENFMQFRSNSPQFGTTEMKLDRISSSVPVPNGFSHENLSSVLMREIAESEDYTCITTHGPNSTKTHIFGDTILETRTSNSLDFDYNQKKMESIEKGSILFIEYLDPAPIRSSNDILSFCGNCNNKLDQRKDIYIYLGEKAFCSKGCRNNYIGEEIEGEEIMIDESPSLSGSIIRD